MLLKNCSYIITQDRDRRILRNFDIRIENSKIREVGKNLNSEVILDCRNKIVMPGLINAHSHLAMTLLRGLCDDKELVYWLKKIHPTEKKLTRKDIYLGTILGCIESIKAGATTVNNSYLFLEEMKKAFEETGLRGFISSSRENGKIKKLRDTELVKISLSGYTPLHFSSGQFLNLKKLSDKHNKIINIHTAETRQEIYECKKKYGKYPVQFLDSIGILSNKTLLDHCNWITKDEINILKKHNCSIVHNPVSNMKLASGSTLPLPELLEKGVNVALGTDGPASNNNLDLFEEMKVVGLLHKYHRWDASAMPCQQIVDMATVNGAKALGINSGSIEEGKNADIITLGINEHLVPLNEKNILSNIVYSANGSDVSDSIINGKLVMKNRKLVNLKEEVIIKDAEGFKAGL